MCPFLSFHVRPSRFLPLPSQTPDGRPTGEAFVELKDEEGQKEAMKRHKEVMGTRYIELFTSSKADLVQVRVVSGAARADVQARACGLLRVMKLEATWPLPSNTCMHMSQGHHPMALQRATVTSARAWQAFFQKCPATEPLCCSLPDFGKGAELLAAGSSEALSHQMNRPPGFEHGREACAWMLACFPIFNKVWGQLS